MIFQRTFKDKKHYPFKYYQFLFLFIKTKHSLDRKDSSKSNHIQTKPIQIENNHLSRSLRPPPPPICLTEETKNSYWNTFLNLSRLKKANLEQNFLPDVTKLVHKGLNFRFFKEIPETPTKKTNVMQNNEM